MRCVCLSKHQNISIFCILFFRRGRNLVRWKNPRRMLGKDRTTLKYKTFSCLLSDSIFTTSCWFVKTHQFKQILYRKWLRSWPIGLWGSFGELFSPPRCRRRSWVCMEAGRANRNWREPGWPRSSTQLGSYTWVLSSVFKQSRNITDVWIVMLLFIVTRGCHEALSALEIPNDLLQVISDLLLDLRVHCLMMTLLHTTEGEAAGTELKLSGDENHSWIQEVLFY